MKNQNALYKHTGEAFAADAVANTTRTALSNTIRKVFADNDLRTAEFGNALFDYFSVVRELANQQIKAGKAYNSKGEKVENIRDYSLYNTIMKTCRNIAREHGYSIKSNANSVTLHKVEDSTNEQGEGESASAEPPADSPASEGAQTIKSDTDLRDYIVEKLNNVGESIKVAAANIGMSEVDAMLLYSEVLQNQSDAFFLANGGKIVNGERKAA